MKTILTVILLVILLFYGMGTRIEFRPFRIYFDSWVWFLGLILTLLGVSIIFYAGHRDGRQRGRVETLRTLMEIANDQIRDDAENHVQ